MVENQVDDIILVLARELSTQEDRWSDLPAGLVAIIAGQNHTDIIRFRSVCRSWRSALPPRRNNTLFPLSVSFSWEGRRLQPTVHLTVTTVYLIRHLRDSWKVWMVAVQESSAGKLLLQHPLTDQTIPGSPGTLLHLSEWKVTQIATSYRDNIGSSFLDNIGSYERQNKVVLVPNSTIALCRHPQLMHHLCTFSTDHIRVTNAFTRLSLVVHRSFIEDFVWFDGWIYLVVVDDPEQDAESYNIFMLDSKSLQRFGIVCDNLRSYLNSVRAYILRFVVSDGDLYIVVGSTLEEYFASECRVFRLVRDDVNVPTRCRWERVESLGDRVFFVVRTGSFSVSARDLPRPWKGNCVVINVRPFEGFEVFDLGDDRYLGVIKRWHRLLLESYSDLFTPTPLLHPQTT